MRQSQTLIPTLKESPADAEIASHRLLVRGGALLHLDHAPLFGGHGQGALRPLVRGDEQGGSIRGPFGAVDDLGGDIEARPDQHVGVARRDVQDFHRPDRGHEIPRLHQPIGGRAPVGDEQMAHQGHDSPRSRGVCMQKRNRRQRLSL